MTLARQIKPLGYLLNLNIYAYDCYCLYVDSLKTSCQSVDGCYAFNLSEYHKWHLILFFHQ